jgi:[acyl-carrier-protein] S-malonyltransferase
MRQRFENAENAAIVEFPPAGTLVGIAKRELRGVPAHAVKSPADLDGLTSL